MGMIMTSSPLKFKPKYLAAQSTAFSSSSSSSGSSSSSSSSWSLDSFIEVYDERLIGIMNFRNLDEFWAFYVGQHSRPTTRRLHFIGTICSLACLLLSLLLLNIWILLLVPLTGYGFAWYSHFFVERNAPASFGHPLWSLLCDFKMFGLMLTGRMDKEIKRLGKRPVLQAF